jgi:hypothetical protein
MLSNYSQDPQALLDQPETMANPEDREKLSQPDPQDQPGQQDHQGHPDSREDQDSPAVTDNPAIPVAMENSKWKEVKNINNEEGRKNWG